MLSANQSMLSRISSRYDLIDKNEPQANEEPEKNVEELSAIVKGQYKELDIYSTQNVLHNRFWRVRSKFERIMNATLFSMIGAILTMSTTLISILFMRVADMMPKISSSGFLAIAFTPFVASVIGCSAYVLKTNKNHKKLFNKLNSQLGENVLEENLDKTFEMALEEQQKIESMIKDRIRDISLTKVQLQESKRYLDMCMTEEDKKNTILEQDFYKSEITREDILNNSNKYNDCDASICMGKFNADEEYEKGPKLVKKINHNNKNN